MPIGVLTDNIMVALGGLLGGALGSRIPEHVKDELNRIFGFAALGIGITLVVKVHSLGAVVLAVILGTLLGALLRLEERVNSFFAGLNERIMKKNRPDDAYMALFSTVLVLSCCSGTGIFGSMNEALTGDSTTILCKAILDFFTVMIFATVLGKFTAIIAIPQMVILLTLFFCAKLILPVMTDIMIADFSAVGGIIELVIAFRILKLTQMKAIDVWPALFLIFPVTELWNAIF